MGRPGNSIEEHFIEPVTNRLVRILTSQIPDSDKLIKALQETVEACGCSGGLLVVQSPRDGSPSNLVKVSLPDSWESQIQTAQSPLRLLLDRVYRYGDVVTGPADLHLACALALPSRMGFQGILALSRDGFEAGVQTQSLSSAAAAAFLIGKHLDENPFEAQRPGLSLPESGLKNESLVEAGQSLHAELLRSRNTLRALFDSIPSSIYIIDQDYHLVALNMSRANRAHERPRSIVGQKCYEALFNRKEPCQRCQVNETLTKGVSTLRYDRPRGRDSQMAEWEISTYPIYGSNNEPSQAIVVETDITERRRLEIALIQSEKLAALGQLAAGVAHEINNPLAAILANAQIASQEVDPHSDLYEAIRLIHMAGERASDVVANLLRLSRKEDYEYGALNLNETIHNAVMLMQHAIANLSVELKLDLEEDLPDLIGSANNLQGLWINLIQNALDAFEASGGSIVIQTRKSEQSLLVRITDNGKGIEPDYLSRIFEPFYTTKQIGRGTGLGLSLCHQIVKQHGGTIRVESQLGIGTEFEVVLPLDAGDAL